MSKVSGKAFDSHLLRRIFQFTKPYSKLFYGSVILTLLIAFIAPVRPLLTQFMLDHQVAVNDITGLKNYTIILLILLITQSIMQYYHAWLTNLIGQNVIRDMRTGLFNKMINFRLSYFDRTPVGTTVTRSVSDMETVADIFSEGLIVILGDMLQLIVIISVMFWVDWRLALISLSTIPLLMLATNIFKNKIKAVFAEVRTQVAHLNTFVQEHLTGMRIIQIFNRQNEEYIKFKAINNEHRNANIRSVWYYSIFFPVVEILSAISIGLIVWWGAGGVIRGDVTFGNLVAFIMYINMLFRPIRELADKFNTLQMGMVSSERIFKVMDEDELPEDIESDATIQKGMIEFKDVWFAYDYHNGNNKDPEYVLKGINFKVMPGETVAFVGATGAGKSTIISLLNRFYEISKGTIYIDNIDIKKYSLEHLRNKVAVVLQDVFLFSDTITNNIRLFDESVTKDLIKRAAVQVGADEFISRLPDGYDFNVMERGSMLSMGQRQLLSFIRALIYKPAILVLDEATSSVDSETEELITKATLAITTGRTSIIIAHRLATVQNARRIIVLDHGEIVESGSHTELLRMNGIYKSLFEIQFNHLV
jgi:ATP-binding cassette subfamily B multidrug efflux pump